MIPALAVTMFVASACQVRNAPPEGSDRGDGSAQSVEQPPADAGDDAPPAPPEAPAEEPEAVQVGDAGRSGFLTRQGKQLMLDGKPFRYVGFNYWTMIAQCGYQQENPSHAQIEEYFAWLRPNTVTRMWAFSSHSMEQIDFVVKTAAKHHQKLILSLTDHHGSACDKDYKEQKKPEKFYTSEHKNLIFPWVDKIVGKYKDDPTIAMWELINEPQPENGQVVVQYVNSVGKHVRDIDKNHLITVGLHGDWVGGWYKDVVTSQYVDVAQAHDYDEGKAKIIPNVRSYQQAPDKPFIIGEWGSPASNGKACGDEDEWIALARQKLDATYKAAPNVAGTHRWNMIPNRYGGCDIGKLYPGAKESKMINTYQIPK